MPLFTNILKGFENRSAQFFISLNDIDDSIVSLENVQNAKYENFDTVKA